MSDLDDKDFAIRAPYIQKIIELEKKLAEQQCERMKLRNALKSIWVVIPQSTFFAQAQIDKANELIDKDFGKEELTKLIAQAKAEQKEEDAKVSLSFSKRNDDMGAIIAEAIRKGGGL